MGIVPRAAFANDHLNRYSQGYDLPSAPRSAGMVCGRVHAREGSDDQASRFSRNFPAAACVPEKGVCVREVRERHATHHHHARDA